MYLAAARSSYGSSLKYGLKTVRRHAAQMKICETDLLMMNALIRLLLNHIAGCHCHIVNFPYDCP